jgi:beta-phosphoglucomutase
LGFLKAHDQFINLGSASKNALPILDKTNILHYFDAIVDGNDVSNAKPDPEVFIRAAQLVGVSNTNSIVFEDSVAGIQAANAAQMISIGVGDPLVLHEAQYHFKDFTSLEDAFLEKLIN